MRVLRADLPSRHLEHLSGERFVAHRCQGEQVTLLAEGIRRVAEARPDRLELFPPARDDHDVEYGLGDRSRERIF